MASSTKSAGAGANDNTGGGSAWNSPGNITASDNNDAYTGGISGDSQYLKATSFGFAIPAGATIDGIVVDVRRQNNGGAGQDKECKLVKGGVIQSTNKAVLGDWGSAYATATYGASNDLWDTTWTAEEINASDFGFVIKTQNLGGNNSTDVDHIQITVHYTEGAAGHPAIKRMGGIEFNAGPFGQAPGMRGW